MKVRKAVYFIFLLLFCGGATFSTFKILEGAKEFKLNREKYTEAVILTEGILNPISWLPNGSWESKVKRAEVFKNRSNRAYEQIVDYGLYTAYGAIVMILASVFLFLRKLLIWRYISSSLLVISIYALIIGVSTPMMEMAAFNTDLTIPVDLSEAKASIPMIPEKYLEMVDFDVRFDGRMYYFYQSKSILGLIGILFAQENYPVAIAILLFSLILPVIKLLCSFGQLASPRFARSKAVYFITNKLGKWSMADVFVVALLLGYLSLANMSVGVESQSEVLFGLYCFGLFVILSLLATHFVNAALKKESEVIPLNNESGIGHGVD